MDCSISTLGFHLELQHQVSCGAKIGKKTEEFEINGHRNVNGENQ